MIVEDTTAYVERLEVDLEDKRTKKQRRRVGAARAATLECQSDIRIAREYLAALEAQAKTDRSVHREVESVRSFAARKQQRLERRRKQLKRLEEELERLQARRRSVVTFRLHCAEHHLDCSEERFTKLQSRQRTTPRLLVKNKGRQWWWYNGRFWWDDARLSARALEAAVREVDLMAALQRHLVGEARAGALDSASAHAVEGISETVRVAVWRRHGGCCEDCGSENDLCFTSTTPADWGDASDGVLTVNGVTLLCKTCSALRARPGGGATLVWDIAAS